MSIELKKNYLVGYNISKIGMDYTYELRKFFIDFF